MPYPVHTIEDAPEAARATLATSRKAFGFVPNLIGVMAAAPALVEAYLTLGGLFARTSFSPSEQQVVLLAVSYVNGCEYCVAAHTAIAGMQKVPDDVVDALRTGNDIADDRLQALRAFTASVVEGRGWPARAAEEAFFAAGYTRAQALEVVLGVGMKTLSNYTNHLADTPLDEAFQPAKWTKAA